ncbi:unnamed protein product [Calicophoron daubneyi]
MLEELIAVEAQDEQQSLFSSYIPNSVVPKPTQLNPRIKVDKENIDRPLESDVSFSDKTGPICVYPKDFSELYSTDGNTDQLVEWPLNVLTFDKEYARYMHQPTIEKAEVLDNWTWNVCKRILAELPEDVFNEIDSSKVTFSSQLTPSSFSQTLNAAVSVASQPTKSSPTTLERTSMLRATSSRLQTVGLLAGRITVRPSVIATPGETRDVKAEGSCDNASTMVGTAVIQRKQRLQAGNAAIIGVRRVEGGRSTSEGATQLTLPMTGHGCSVYSGQPVVLRATNSTGQVINVAEAFEGSVLHPPEIKEQHQNLRLMFACGPYTLSSSHDPSLLLCLLRAVKQNRPHVLILTGPFVDADHPTIQSYSEMTYEELFQSRLNSVAEYCCHLKVPVVVVSSWRELHHDAVYPTPPFDKSWTQQTPELMSWYKNVHFVWDPCALQIGEYVFGVTSVDVVFDLSNEELSSGCSGDRMTRLCRHVLSSGSFYPVHPPGDTLPLDYNLWYQCAHWPVMPHCFIFPSRLRQFVKNVDGVMCVNPGYVSRGHASGSYAFMEIGPVKRNRDSSQTNAENGHTKESDAPSRWSLAELCSVTVNRL